MKQILIMLFAFMANFANATSTPSFITVGAEKSVVVNLTNWVNKEVTISIKSESGYTFHTENVKNTQNFRKYNLSNLEQGQYVIKIEDAYKVANQTFTIGNSLAVGEVSNITYKPSVSTIGDKVLVNALLLSKPANVQLTDNNGNVIYTDNVANKGSYSRILNIEKLEKGNYTMTVNTDGETFSYNVQK